MKNNIYIFSGLGADERVFQNIDFSGYPVTFINWIRPYQNESIENYATRIRQKITSEEPVLIGLSFGGIMAIEVAKQIPVRKIILISSAKTIHEIPYYFRQVGKLGIQKLLPASWLKKSNFIADWFFGVTSQPEKKLLKQIIKDTDPVFMQWAIEKIFHWTNNTVMQNAFHIHGTRDRILPIRNIACDYKVIGGGHLMILNKAEELSRLIKQQLE